MNRNVKAQRLEPLLTASFINRDFVNAPKKLKDITEVTKPTDPYTTLAYWLVFGLLVVVVGWVAVNL